MQHLEILTRLLPPVAYDAKADATADELSASATVLDEAMQLLEQLIAELDPRSTYSLLDDFERVYGLPDQCVYLTLPTVEERRLAVVQQIVARGSQTPAYFEGLAAALGYEGARVREYLPWTCVEPCTEPITTSAWRHVWGIESLPAERITFFTCTAPCTEPLANWSAIEPLSCVINRLKPAHTVCLFDFGEV